MNPVSSSRHGAAKFFALLGGILALVLFFTAFSGGDVDFLMSFFWLILLSPLIMIPLAVLAFAKKSAVPSSTPAATIMSESLTPTVPVDTEKSSQG